MRAERGILLRRRGTEGDKMTERQGYLFVYRLGGGEVVKVRHPCRAGDAEALARRIARTVGRKHGTDEVRCVWMGPGEEIPEKIRRELLS